ncbi:stress response transcriptional regulator NmlR [Streptococcus tangpeifui]|uniref:stress response transcriptional regulator NmlR n=1 Tax=Streptococcus tangpeifui TaxID=2709400 RepID=UPI0013EE0550|nr:stress response transcriptional regulator NmlR [Streptococcus sp. ZJ373]
MNIKKVSKLTGISADTIRYYERIGLIPPVTRNQAGVRDFTEHDISILQFIRCFKRAGLSIGALKAYTELLQAGDENIQARLTILKEQREGLQKRIDDLNEALKRLNYKIDNYENKIALKEKRLFHNSKDS